MRYSLSRKAEDDLIAVYRESARLYGRLQADRYFDGLMATFRFIADHPRAARSRSEIRAPVRIHPFKAHLVVYELNDDGSVTILRVRHARENWQADPS